MSPLRTNDAESGYYSADVRDTGAVMDLHPPGGPVRSVKDFFVHIGVVILGILIALGLEQLVEALMVIDFTGHGALTSCDAALTAAK
jgi:hypothetical protein